MIESIAAFARKRGWNLYDLAIMRGGQAESAYLQDCNKCNDSYSVAKAFTMTAIGMLWDEGKLALEDPIIRVLGDALPARFGEMWEKVTIHHALSHRIGLPQGLLDIDVDDVSQYGTRDYLAYLFRHEPACEPGTRYAYTDAAYYLLSRVVSALTGKTLCAFLTERLFAPLGFSEIAWSNCPLGYSMGATGLYVSAADMVKLAWLYQRGGVWGGERLLSKEWIDVVLARRYEFAPVGTSDWLGKGGMYGQMIAFSPARDMAVAWHGFERNADYTPLLAFIDML